MSEDDDVDDNGLENEDKLPEGRTQVDGEGGEDENDENDEGSGRESDDDDSVAENTSQRTSHVRTCLFL